MPLRPVDRTKGEHYTWGNSCDGWHLLQDAALSVIEERMPPGTAETLHCHQRSQQFFYVLAGEAVMEGEGHQVRLTAREGLHIRPGIFHQIRNESNRPLEFRVISQPPSHGDRVIAARDAKY